MSINTLEETEEEQLAETPSEAAEAPITKATQQINVAGDTVTKATAELEESERRLVRWAFDYARAQDWPWREAARFFKLSTTTLYRVWTDKYRQPAMISDGKNKPQRPNPRAGERVGLTTVCEALSKAKRLADARAGVSKLPFILTSVYQRLEFMADEVQATQSVGFVFGESQIGKTRCLEEYVRRHNHGQTVLVTMPPAAGVQLMCKEIARKLNIGGCSFDNTFTRIIDALDESRLLIVDEAHMIFETYQRTSVKRCLATLRHIHDRSKCGLLISATDVFATEARNSEFRNTMKQFFRRGTLTLQLGTQPPWEDVASIWKHYQLPDPPRAEEETLRLLAKEDGLGKITMYLAGAARMAAKKNEPLNWSHFARYVKITEKMALAPKEGK